MDTMPSAPANEPTPSPTPRPTPRTIDATRRVAPRLLPMIIAGAVLGVVAALITALRGPGGEDSTTGSVFGYLAMLFLILGAGIGGAVGLILDRLSRRRTHQVRLRPVEHSPEDADGL